MPGPRRSTPPAVPGTLREAATLAALAGAGLAAGALGSGLSAGALATWYPDLTKPAWTPPSWVFGPVWTALYLLIGWAAWRVIAADGLRSRPMAWWGAQLAANAAWTPVFFGLRSPGLALVVILVLLVLVAGTLRAFHRVDRPAAYALAPYAAWVAFAAALNAAIWAAN